MKFTNVILRIFQNRFQQICIIISVSGDMNVLDKYVVNTRQIVASISMTSQFHKFSFACNFWQFFVNWNLI